MTASRERANPSILLVRGCSIGLLAIGIAASAAAIEDPAAVPEASSGEAAPVATFPLHRARIYPVRSEELWKVSKATMAELGFRFERERLDEEHGVGFTSWTKRKSIRDTGFPTADGSGRVQRLRIQVFVPRGFEPGRLYLSSVVEIRVGGRGTRLAFHSVAIHDWVYERIESALGSRGRARPRNGDRMRTLALELAPWKEIPDECREIPMGQPYDLEALESSGRRFREPVRLEKSYFRPIYPDSARAQGDEAVIEASGVVQADGWLSDAKIESFSGRNEEFAVSSAAAMSFWRYRPLYVDACPVPSRLESTIEFTVH